MTPAISVSHLNKIYASGFQALKDINLEIRSGEIFALLGPNGAGKTTLISIICGIVKASSGSVLVAGHDINSEYRTTRSLIGLVPQELANDMFIIGVVRPYRSAAACSANRATPPTFKRCSRIFRSGRRRMPRSPPCPAA